MRAEGVVQSFTSQMTEVFFIEIDNVVGNIDGWRFFLNELFTTLKLAADSIEAV